MSPNLKCRDTENHKYITTISMDWFLGILPTWFANITQGA